MFGGEGREREREKWAKNEEWVCEAHTIVLLLVARKPIRFFRIEECCSGESEPGYLLHFVSCPSPSHNAHAAH